MKIFSCERTKCQLLVQIRQVLFGSIREGRHLHEKKKWLYQLGNRRLTLRTPSGVTLTQQRFGLL
jgi:hypothetical protein